MPRRGQRIRPAEPHEVADHRTTHADIDRPSPEVTASHILAALSDSAPPRVVIALRRADQHVEVVAITDTTDWRDRVIADVVSERAELEAALGPDGRDDIVAIDALAADLTEHISHRMLDAA